MKYNIITATVVVILLTSQVMAWTVNGKGDNVNISGSFIPENATPWEVLVGPSIANLDVFVKAGEKKAELSLTKSLPLLGIRTITDQPFTGGPNIEPQIDFHGAVDLNGFVNGVTTMKLDIIDANDGITKLGELVVPFTSVAIGNDKSTNLKYAMIATSNGQSWFGGVPLISSGASSYSNSLTLARKIHPEAVQNYNEQNISGIYPVTTGLFNGGPHSGFYAAGIQSGSTVVFNLSSPATSGVLFWKASLPITISYQ